MADAGARLAAAALALVGTPFRASGRRHGLDCLGLVLAAGRAAGLELGPRPPGPVRGLDRRQAAAMLAARGWRPVAASRLGVGDLLLSWPASRQPHLALACGSGRLVEADSTIGRVIERGVGPADTAPPATAWRPPGDRGSE